MEVKLTEQEVMDIVEYNKVDDVLKIYAAKLEYEIKMQKKYNRDVINKLIQENPEFTRIINGFKQSPHYRIVYLGKWFNYKIYIDNELYLYNYNEKVDKIRLIKDFVVDRRSQYLNYAETKNQALNLKSYLNLN